MSYSSHVFPDDLLYDLLYRLPTKTLLKFKCVSKLWLSIIEDPEFSSIHAKRLSDSACQSPSSVTQVCLISNFGGVGGRRVYKICTINWSGGFDGVVQELCPIPLDTPKMLLVGSSNGVLCRVCHISRIRWEIILWNPLSRKYHIIPPPPLQFHSYVYSYTFGFGYDEVNGDYKVLWFETRCERPRAAVYSKKMNTWRTIDDGFPTPSEEGDVCVLFGGALHYISIFKDISSLIAFDLAKEEFNSFPVPKKEFNSFPVPKNKLLIMRDGLLCMKMFDGTWPFSVQLMLNYDEWIEFKFEQERDLGVAFGPNHGLRYMIPIAYAESPKPVMMMLQIMQGVKDLAFYDVEQQTLIFNSEVGEDIDGICNPRVSPYIQTLELYK